MEQVNKKEKEKWAVLKFYKNQGISINETNLYFPEDNNDIDVIVKDKKSQVKFQVKSFPAAGEEVEGRLSQGENHIISRQNKQFTGEFKKLKGLGKIPSTSAGGSFNEIKDEVVSIIEKASNKYSVNSKKNIILLVNNRHLSDSLIERALNNCNFVFSKKRDFREIYLVGFSKNQKIN